MKALVYHSPGNRSYEEKSKPTIKDSADAIVWITTTIICWTDLHVIKGDEE
jgi:alcohol dehydrogenase